MPRNIEFNIDRYIENKNYPNLVLTLAIQEGLNVPEKVLNVFGSGYGIDNEFVWLNLMTQRKVKSELLLDKLSQKKEFSQSEMLLAKQEKYTEALNIYNKLKNYNDEEKEKLAEILNKFDEFVINNEKQRKFVTLLKNNIQIMIIEIDSKLKGKEPIEETSMEVYLRLEKERNQEIKDAQDYIAFYDNYNSFDGEFFEELIKDWFGSRMP